MRFTEIGLRFFAVSAHSPTNPLFNGQKHTSYTAAHSSFPPNGNRMAFGLGYCGLYGGKSRRNRNRLFRHLAKPIGTIARALSYAKERCRCSEEPRLFSDEQFTEFFEKVDTQITTTPTFPYNDVIYPVMFRLIYCCGLRSSEACNLKVEDVDLMQGTLSIYRSKGFRDCLLHMSDDVQDLCLRFHKSYSKIIPARTYFFQPSPTKDHLESFHVGKVFDSVLKKPRSTMLPAKNLPRMGSGIFRSPKHQKVRGTRRKLYELDAISLQVFRSQKYPAHDALPSHHIATIPSIQRKTQAAGRKDKGSVCREITIRSCFSHTFMPTMRQ